MPPKCNDPTLGADRSPRVGRRAVISDFKFERGVSLFGERGEWRRSTMSQRTLRISVLAMLLLFMGGVSAQADETFTVRIENVSAKDALKLSNGKTEPVTVAPVLYVIHTNRAPLFTSGEPDRGKGLEALAEDGPTGPLAESLKGQPGIVHVGSTDTPVGALSPGDITSQIMLWDAGTEVNEEPGLGPNQAPLQPAPHTGPREHGVVRPISEVNDGFHYPSVAEVLRVTITPGPVAKR